jgi:two-component system cell cycle sensor histidine kinase/response regulator CckA
MIANARLDAVFRASPLAFLTLDREARVTGWNATAEHIFGWSSEEVVGKSLPFATGQSEEIIQGIVGRTLQGESILGVEMKQWRKDGSPFDAAIWTAGLRDSEGLSGVLVTVADVSIRKRLEDELRLSQKMEAIGRLAGGVAHDFNNLLTAIIGYNGLLMDSVVNEPILLAYGREVQGAAERAAVLTRQLLTFSRRHVSKPTLLNLNDGVLNMRNLLSRVIGEDIEIVTKLQADLGSVRVDPVELDQVVMNLAVNARDAMPEGGRLLFETANVIISAGEEYDTVSVPGDYVMLRVQDTGCGMDAATKSRLFEPFFTTKQQGKGTGLGLSIIYGVVQQNGGFIAVDSEVGAGATFSIYLPRCRDVEEDRSISIAAARPSVTAAGTTLLLVEDEDIIRQLAAALLRAQGYRILEASTPAEALTIGGEYPDPIRLLVTDVLMPGMRGNELAERLRELRPGLAVLYMSGYLDSTFLSTAALEGAGFLQKPFMAADLVRAVSEVLQGESGVRSKST